MLPRFSIFGNHTIILVDSNVIQGDSYYIDHSQTTRNQDPFRAISKQMIPLGQLISSNLLVTLVHCYNNFRFGKFQPTSYIWIQSLFQAKWRKYIFRYVSDNGAWYGIIDTDNLGEQDKLSNLPNGSRAARSVALPMRCTVGKFEYPRHKIWLSYSTINSQRGKYHLTRNIRTLLLLFLRCSTKPSNLNTRHAPLQAFHMHRIVQNQSAEEWRWVTLLNVCMNIFAES